MKKPAVQAFFLLSRRDRPGHANPEPLELRRMKRIAIINPSAGTGIVKGLRKLDIEPIPVDPAPELPASIAGHPDLQVFTLGGRLFCHPGISPGFMDRIGGRCEIIRCTTPLGPGTAGAIPYCVACTGAAAFHRTELTDAAVRQALGEEGLTVMHVRQGFARCSTVIVTPRRIITADRGILRTALEAGIDALQVSPGHVAIDGFRYGFLGGASGLCGSTVLFTGTLDCHPDREAILRFIEEAGCSAHALSQDPVIDIGSILVIDE
jgi:hypothetical protein